MERLSWSLVIYLSEFLDIHSLLSLRAVSKGMLSTLNNYLQIQLSKKQPATIRTDALFDYNYKLFATNLSLRADCADSVDAGKVYVDMLHSLRHPMRCILRGLEDSSHDYEQDIHSTYHYLDSRFWSSKGSLIEDANEFLIFELETLSVIFEVQFRNYRALYQGGLLYPSKYIQIKVGQEINKWSYESEILPVEFTEELQHVFLLPNLVIGKYVKIELIGKLTVQIEDNKYYSVLDFVDILGFPTNNLRCKQLIPLLRDYLPEISNEIEEKPIDLENMETIPPFEIMKHLNDEFLIKLKDEIESNPRLIYGNKYLNDISVLYLLKRNIIDSESVLIQSSRYEIIADELYNREEYDIARSIYGRTGNGRKMIKTFLKMREFNDIIIHFLREHPLLPKLTEIKQIAVSLGAEIYEGFCAALISHGRREDS